MTPVFVYGTLRPGESNYVLLEGVTDREITAYAYGLQLHEGPGFPYATSGGAGYVIGTLCFLRRGIDQLVMQRLDTLEGFDPKHPDRGHYVRRQTPVTYRDPAAGGSVRTESAWVYLAGPSVDLSSKPLIPSGDWIAHAQPPHRQSSLRSVG